MAHFHSRILGSHENNNPQVCQTVMVFHMNITMREKNRNIQNHTKISVRTQVYCMSTCDRQWLSKWLPSCEWVQQHLTETRFSWDELRICNSDGGSSSWVRSCSQDVQGSLGYLEMDRTQDHLSGASEYGTNTMWLSCFFVTVVSGHTLGRTVAYQQREGESRRRLLALQGPRSAVPIGGVWGTMLAAAADRA